MPAGSDALVRSHGVEPAPPPPGRRLLAVVVLLAAVGLLLTYVAADPTSESDRSAITTPDIPDGPAPSVLTPVPNPPIADPLDRHVPGFSGTLVMTVGTAEGTEVWRWSSGPDGVLERTIPVPDLYDAAPDPSGTQVVALRRYGHDETSLQSIGPDGDLSPILFGAQGFAWHAARPTAIAFASQTRPLGPVQLHAGQWITDGVWFKPAAELVAHDLLGGNPYPDRLVGYDDDGVVIERAPLVERLSMAGTMLGSVQGTFVGMSSNGQVAVADDSSTVIYSGPGMQRHTTLPASYSSVVWTGQRMGATHFESESVDLIDGSAVRTVEVGPIHPTVLTWSPDGRFLLIAGHAEPDSLLVFVDAANLDVTTIILTGSPIAAVVVP